MWRFFYDAIKIRQLTPASHEIDCFAKILKKANPPTNGMYQGLRNRSDSFRAAVCTRDAADGLISVADFQEQEQESDTLTCLLCFATQPLTFKVSVWHKPTNCPSTRLKLYLYCNESVYFYPFIIVKVQFVDFAHAKLNVKQKFQQSEYTPPKSGKYSFILFQKEPLWIHLTVISITKKGRTALLQHFLWYKSWTFVWFTLVPFL